jgi:hypothetical protein
MKGIKLNPLATNSDDIFLQGVARLLESCDGVGPMSDYADVMKISEAKAEELASNCSTSVLLSLLIAARYLSGVFKLHGKLEGELFAGVRLSTLDDFHFNLLKALERKCGYGANDSLIFYFLSDLISYALDDELLQACVQAIGSCSNISATAVQFLVDQARRTDTSEDYRIVVIDSIAEMHSIAAQRRVFEVKDFPSMQSPRIQRRLFELFEFIEASSQMNEEKGTGPNGTGTSVSD